MTAGYSGTPLPKKLGIVGRANILIARAPAEVLRELGFARAPRPAASQALDFALVFTRSRAELQSHFRDLVRRLAPDGVLWVGWPKKSSGVATDLDENVVRELGLAAGVVDVKVCAVSEVWSGLKFVFRLKDRRTAK